MFKHLLAAAALSTATMLPAMASTASTATGTLNLNASVVNACSVSVGTINMSAYDVFGGDSTGSTTASVTCTKGAAPNIAFASSVVLNNSANSDQLTVGLSQAGSLGVSTSMSAPQSVTINADAASGQDVSAGSYSGSTTVTISF